MTLRVRRAVALLLFLAAVLHPAVHGESLGTWSGASISDASLLSDCPCVRAAVISTDAPAETSTPLVVAQVQAESGGPLLSAEPSSVPSRAPPSA